MDNGYPTREKVKDAAGAIFLVACFYAAWCLVAVIEPH